MYEGLVYNGKSVKDKGWEEERGLDYYSSQTALPAQLNMTRKKGRIQLGEKKCQRAIDWDKDLRREKEP